MKRIEGVNIDTTKWDVNSYYSTGYILKEKETGNSYELCGDIIGVEQVSDYEFIVCRRMFYDQYHMYRFKLKSGEVLIKFHKDFKKYFFLTDDTILFDNKYVYSIKNNSKVKEFDWLKYKKLEVHNSEEDDKNYIFVEEKIESYPLPDEYVQYVVDSEKFNIVSDAYSTLRGNMVNLNDEYKIDDLINEDRKYLNIINARMVKTYNNVKNNGKIKVLSDKKIHGMFYKMN